MAGNMPSGVEVAGLLRRLLGWVIDILPPVLLGGLSYWLVPQLSATTALVTSLLLVLLQLAWALLVWWMYATRGAGPGFKVAGLQLVGLADGKPIGWGRYFLRQLVWGAISATGIGLIALLVFLVIHERRMGWHDQAVKAVAIQARKAAPAQARRRPEHNRSASPSTTVALPPHLIAAAFDGTRSAGAVNEQRPDPAQQAAQAASFGGGGVREQSGWQPPAAPGQASAPEQRPVQPRPSASSAASAPSAAPVQPAVRPYQPNVAPQRETDTQNRPRPKLAEEEDDYGTRMVPRAGAAPQRSGQEGWVLQFDDGRKVPVQGLVLVGRKPVAPDAGTTVVALGEGGHAVSKTHLAVGVDQRGVHVTDRGSTNGTALVNARGELEPCQPGVQTRCREGQIVSFGDRSFTVTRTPAVAPAAPPTV